MANRRDIKRRINSVVNTQKITKAMKLVAAAKFARASHAVLAARPYSSAFAKIGERLINAAAEKEITSVYLNPNSRQSGQTSYLVLVLGTDRGLCGALNTNLQKNVRQFVRLKQTEKNSADIKYYPLGRKMISWAKKQSESIFQSRERVLEKPTYSVAKELAAEVCHYYKNSGAQILIAHSVFQNALTQKPALSKLLPFSIEDFGRSTEAGGEGKQVQKEDPRPLLIEPDLSAMFDRFVEHWVAQRIFQAMLDGAASEHGSRMTAMDSASSNAGEVRKKLVLKYNRARQAAITKELIEIISGAQAV